MFPSLIVSRRSSYGMIAQCRRKPLVFVCHESSGVVESRVDAAYVRHESIVLLQWRAVPEIAKSPIELVHVSPTYC